MEFQSRISESFDNMESVEINELSTFNAVDEEGFERVEEEHDIINYKEEEALENEDGGNNDINNIEESFEHDSLIHNIDKEERENDKTERLNDTELLYRDNKDRDHVINAAILAAKAATEAAKAAAEAAAVATAAAEACCGPRKSGNYQELPIFEGGNAAQIASLRPSQSPIAISVQRCPTWTSLEPLHFNGYVDNPNNATITNTGQTAYFTFPQGQRPKLAGGPLLGEYVFEQLHFHWSVDDFTGCEHVLDGHGYACEAHFVHYNSKYGSLEAAVGHPDGLAVVGFLLQSVDAPNPRFDTLISALDSIRQPGQTVELSADGLAWLDERDLYGSYVTYKGSLTTPPYTECVTWIIYETPVHIGSEQLGVFRQLEGSDRQLIERNVRPTQRHPPGHSVIKVEQNTKSKI